VTRPGSSPTGNLTWSTPVHAVLLILRGATLRTAGRVAVVVGTLLTVINQGSALIHGLDAVTVARVLANYAIPYCVASVGYLAPFRDRSTTGR